MQKTHGEIQRTGMSGQTTVLIIAIGLLIAGTGGLFVFRGWVLGYILAHLGAVGLTGIIAGVTGLIARKKGFHYWKTFVLSLGLPLVLGLASALGVFSLPRSAKRSPAAAR